MTDEKAPTADYAVVVVLISAMLAIVCGMVLVARWLG